MTAMGDVYRISSSANIPEMWMVTGIQQSDIPEIGEIFEGARWWTNIILNLRSCDEVGKMVEDARKFDSPWYLWCSEKSLDILLDKAKTKEYLSSQGFEVTKWFSFNWDFVLLKEQMENNWLFFPIVLKETSLSWWEWIYICSNYEELRANFFDSKDYVVEEYVDWTEFSVTILAHELNSWEKNVLVYPFIEKGKTAFRWNTPLHSLEKIRQTYVWDMEIKTQLSDIANDFWQLSWVKGFCEVELILDNKDWKLKIIEVNPRTSWTLALSMFSADTFLEGTLDLLSNEVHNASLIPTSNFMEIPLVHTDSDFNETELSFPEWVNLKTKKCLRKFPPYIEKFLVEFKDNEAYKNFMIINNLSNED